MCTYVFVCECVCVCVCVLKSHLLSFKPLLQQLFASLLQDGSAELQSLQGVELALVQQHPKVLQQGGGLARGRRHTLELTNGVRRTQNPLKGQRGCV